MSSTGSGPLVRLTVDVATPQAWRPSATHIGVAMGENALRMECFMDTAGTLIVREPSDRSTKSRSAAKPSDERMLLRCAQMNFARSVPRRTGSIVDWNGGQDLDRLGAYYTATSAGSLGDRRHFVGTNEELPCADDPAAHNGTGRYWLRR